VVSATDRALQEHRFLKGAAIADHPTDLIIGKVELLEFPNGVWIKPDERSSEFPNGSMFVPYRFIFSAFLLDADDEAKLKGFAGS
jgi:hypothetical protein